MYGKTLRINKKTTTKTDIQSFLGTYNDQWFGDVTFLMKEWQTMVRVKTFTKT
jgi:hypothetical protein